MKRWIRIVRAGELDSNTPQTPGMSRAAAITHARTGANNCGRERLQCSPLRAPARIIMASLRPCSTSFAVAPASAGAIVFEFVEEAGPGDFVYVPPFVPHQEMNARADEPVEAVTPANSESRSRLERDNRQGTRSAIGHSHHK